MTEMPKFVEIFALMSACWTSEAFYMLGVSTLITSIFLTCVNLFKLSMSLWYSFILFILLLIFVADLNDFLCFLWDLLGGNSVHWYISKLICVACGSLDTCLMCLAVDLEDSNFFASYLTLLAGNLSRSILESLIVLDTNSSSLRKKPKYVFL